VHDPEVVLRADDYALTLGAVKETREAETVARLSLRARGASYALLDGEPAAAWLPGGLLRSVLRFTVRDDKIATIDVIADPERLQHLQLVFPERRTS
jgi:RNA polymerase sigma-70 factor (ECF subfamily)